MLLWLYLSVPASWEGMLLFPSFLLWLPVGTASSPFHFMNAHAVALPYAVTELASPTSAADAAFHGGGTDLGLGWGSLVSFEKWFQSL